MDSLEIKYSIIGSGVAPQPIRMRLPGWGGSPAKKMENGSEPQPWHCRPFVDAATYGLELLYPFETECHVINEEGVIRFAGGDASPNVLIEGEFGVFDTIPAKFYLFQAPVDIQAPPGYVLQTQPHPRFFTDSTGTVPVSLIGHVQSEWWPRPTFIVFKAPPPGQRHIFRKAEPYVQIIFVPQKSEYDLSQMTPDQALERRRLWDKISTNANYISTNVWHEPGGGEMRNYYKILTQAYEKGGIAGVEDEVRAAQERRKTILPPGKTLADYLELARKCQQEGKFVEAKDIYTRLSMADPQNAELASRQAILLDTMGLPEIALKLFKQAISIKPDESAYYANLGEFLRRQKRLNESEEALRAALKLSPRDPQIGSNLALTLAMQGKLAEALQLCQSAMQTGTQAPEVYLRVGSILAQCGQFAQARACFQTVLSIDSSNEQARRQLERLSAS